jgi:SH3-like domain-containing protein
VDLFFVFCQEFTPRGKAKDPDRGKEIHGRVKMPRAVFTRLLVILSCLLMGLPSFGAAGARGTETNLPVPRFVSLKSTEGNVRRGPSLTHRVDWIFQLVNMPLKITAEYGHWRRVEDSEGQGGWMHYSLLSGARYVLVQEEEISLFLKPNEAAATRAYAERGALARLGSCVEDFCEISAQGAKGWAKKTDIWGVDADELRD